MAPGRWGSAKGVFAPHQLVACSKGGSSEPNEIWFAVRYVDFLVRDVPGT